MQMERQDSSSATEDEAPQPPRPHKNTYEFNLEKGRKLTISSNFDNGNISLSKQLSELHYRLEAVPDFKSKSGQQKKTWFHFCASAPKHFRIRFTIENVSIYENMYEDGNWARPVFRDERGTWIPVHNAFLTYREEVGLVFDHTFISESPVYFALAVPFSYHENETYLRELTYRIPDFIAYKDAIITTTREGLNVHRLSLTHKNIHDSETKPYVLITCRVHPGEVGSSFCLMGILDFLTRSFSLQAHLLLSMFEFVIYPMVNPDGVFGGNYRMDLTNTNLNRVYDEPSPDVQYIIYKLSHSVFAIKKDITQMLKNFPARKIIFHFDLHSHSSLKSAFIYGNAFEDIATQTESMMFCKLLEHNSEVFKYSLSQFTERHMKMKDKGQSKTKEGCARVVLSKLASITYSYTVETAIFPYPSHQSLLEPSNKEFQKDINSFYDNQSMQSMFSRFSTKSTMVIDNALLGYGLMTTILDIFEKNPYSRLQPLEETLDAYRKEISQNALTGEERFKLLDMKAYQKARAISKICKDEFRNKYQRAWNFLSSNTNFTGVKWPSGMKWFQFIAEEKKVKKQRRIKTQSYENSQRQQQLNDFINPKNLRKKLFTLEDDGVESKNQIKNLSPQKMHTPRNIVNIQLPSARQYGLPQIRKSIERNSIGCTNKANVVMKKKISSEDSKSKDEPFLNPLPSLQIKEIKQLSTKDSTKNIVLSFIHEEMQKMSNMKKNAHKNMVVNSKLHQSKVLKKSSSKSLKIFLENEKLRDRSKRKNHQETCEEVIENRKSVAEERKKQEALIEILESKVEDKKSIEACQITSYPTMISQRESAQLPSNNGKREMVKVKYADIKKKNMIRQEMSENMKLPELKNSHFSGYKINNLCIDARVSTTPDEY